MGALFGILTSFAIGAGDLFGRRVILASSALTAAVTLQIVGILTSVASLGVVASTWDAGELGLGALSGLGLGTGMGCYFGGLYRSSSTVVAPVVATLSAVIPFLYAITTGESATALAVAGAVVALAGLLLITTGGAHARNVAVGLRWALFSGLGYGFGLSVLVETTEESGVWPAVGQRLVAFSLLALVALLLRTPLIPPTSVRWAAVFGGIAIGMSTVLLLFGLQANPVPAIVAASMFPAVTVTVGWWVYGDGVSRVQALGIGVVLVGLAGVVSG